MFSIFAEIKVKIWYGDGMFGCVYAYLCYSLPCKIQKG